MMEVKICSQCHQSLSLNKFVKKNNVASGYGNLCKPCKNKNQTSWRNAKRPPSEFDAVQVDGQWNKKCNICLQQLPLESYRKQDRTLKSFSGTACGECHNLRRRRMNDTERNRNVRLSWKERDPEGYAVSVKRRTLRTRFNLSEEEFLELLSRFSETHCYLCSREYGSRGPVIDHDHACCSGRRSCGKCIRGVICNRCNVSLGAVNDNIQTLNNMIGYLT